MASGFLKGYRAFWVYTLARFALFAVLWVILWLAQVPWLFAALIAIVVSVPLSWFLLAKPRQAFAATIEERVNTRRDRTHDLEARLEGEDPAVPAADDSALPPGVSEAPARGRAKRR